MRKRDPEHLYNEGGTFPSDETLAREYLLLKAIAAPGKWMLRRMAAIVKHLGREPRDEELAPDHPRKIPNRRKP